MMTPYGIRAHLPCIDIGQGTGFVLVDIFCHSTHPKASVDNRIYLLLQRDGVANEDLTGLSTYKCQSLADLPEWKYAIPTRIVHITRTKTTSGNHSTHAQWRDIYISARPRHRAHLSSDISELVARLAINAPKFPSFRIQPSMISGEFHCCSAVTRLPPSVSWMGDPPFNLVLKLLKDWTGHEHKFVLTLGVCRGACKDITGTSNSPSQTPHYYAVIKGFKSLEEEDPTVKVLSGNYEAPQHDCQRDHVSHGSIISGGSDRHVRILFKRSLVDTCGETLEVHMEQ